MRLCILSDSHGDTTFVRMLAERETACDAFIHLGDYVQDADELRGLTDRPVYSICGNCDWFARNVPEESVEQFDGVDLLMTHGHNYHVKTSPHALLLHAQERGVRAALFGHTHEPLVDDQDGVLLLNPGALCNGRYAVLEINAGRLVPTLLKL